MASPANGAERPDREAKPASLVEQAYASIKHGIVTTAFAPGASLNEVQLSEELGIGRTPVHHALHRLAQEELVDILPRKGVRVRPVLQDEIAELIEARLVTEPYCAARAAERVREAELEEPRRILAEAEAELVGEGRTEALMKLDGAFHSWANRIAGNRVLYDVLDQFQNRSARFWFLSLSDIPHAEGVHKEHKAILRAIGARDPEAARRAAEDHIKSFRRTILKVI
ncbi:GntR family transcriptional regulator [Martelella sp. FLE1502]|uniref:DNA-binding GntR family transcriptional regulator n=1 Tax=Martelella mediterranea TaxID=293089 RepID=A0A4V2V316_9HYPH|nr:GntR family transcriptional regulator [Martelella mediterranea]TCT28130.1 DNA-binding GntR family transcriptional regulator [Martelella mediterranea]